MHRDLQVPFHGSLCKGICATGVEVWAHPEDLKAIEDVMQQERMRLLGDLEFDQSIANAVLNPEATEATCPACGHVFSTSLRECPDCGLGFQVGS